MSDVLRYLARAEGEKNQKDDDAEADECDFVLFEAGPEELPRSAALDLFSVLPWEGSLNRKADVFYGSAQGPPDPCLLPQSCAESMSIS